MGLRRAPARLRLRDPPHARQAPAGRRRDPARRGLPGVADRDGALARRAPRDAARHAAEARCSSPATSSRVSSTPAGSCGRPGSTAWSRSRCAKKLKHAVVRGRRPPRRGLRGGRAARARARRAHRERGRSAAADRGGARPPHRGRRGVAACVTEYRSMKASDAAPGVRRGVGELLLLAIEEAVRRARIGDDLVLDAGGCEGRSKASTSVLRDSRVVAAHQREDRRRRASGTLLGPGAPSWVRPGRP